MARARRTAIAAAALLALLTAGCSGGATHGGSSGGAATGSGRASAPPRATRSPTTTAPTSLSVTSPAFSNGGTLPRRFTCDGSGHPPPLHWSNGPAGTRAYAVMVDDPDAPNGPFVHWMVLDLPRRTTALTGRLPPAARVADNSTGHASYSPPCPPSGTHHYRFTVYALDAPTRVAGGASLDDALAALASHGIAQGRLVATYARHH